MSFDLPADAPFQSNRPGSPCLHKTPSWCLLFQVLALAGGLLSGPGCGSGSPEAPTAGAGAQATAKGVTGSSPTNSTAASSAACVPVSVFATDVDGGKDPFFPGLSSEQTGTAIVKAAPRAALSTYLKLAGIRTGTIRPLALINQTTFAPGEEGTISILVANPPQPPELQKVNVRCLEIRPESVLVRIAGESGVTELHFAQKD